MNQGIPLKVEASFPDAVIEDGDVIVPPGDTAEIQLKVKNYTGETEVMVVAVDKSILELSPYPLQNPSSAFVLDLSETYDVESSSKFLVAPDVIKTLVDHFLARKELNPWFRPQTEVRVPI